MGPRSIDRGNNTELWVGEAAGENASMGPRSIDRGNAAEAVVAAEDKKLQWGRDQLIAETKRPWSRNTAAGEASMGPRSIDRGNAPRLAGRPAALAASMGPRSIDRGNDFQHYAMTSGGSASMGPRSIDRGNRKGDVITFAGVYAVLQWGRDQLIAETTTGSAKHSLPSELQWGRDQLIAETKKQQAEITENFGFNGAAIN